MTMLLLVGSFSMSLAAAAAPQTWLIEFAEPGVLAQARAGGVHFEARSPSAQMWHQQLQTSQAQRLAQITKRIGRAPRVHQQYFFSHSGSALELTGAEAAQIATLPGIRSVEPEVSYTLAAFRGPTFIGADSIWNGSAVSGGLGSRAQGQRIGIFDTGVNADHPAFAPMGAECGFASPEPKLQSYDCSQPQCLGGSAEDTAGHGSHVASIAAGNTVPVSATPAPAIQFSGVASCARIHVYKVCTPNCFSSSVLAAIDQAIVDEIDVGNFSFAPSVNGALDPWTDPVDRRVLDLLSAGVVVVMAAGNTVGGGGQPSQPLGEVKHVGPWNLTVGASSHDGFAKHRLDFSGGPQDLFARRGTTGPLFAGELMAAVTDAADLGNLSGCTASGAFPAASLSGRIALVQRAGCGFAEPVNNAAAAGALGVIVYNNGAGLPPLMSGQSSNTIPSVMVSLADGQAIGSFLDSNPAAPARIAGTASVFLVPATGSVMLASSLRGPNPRFDVTKPDLNAPGAVIYAAFRDPEQFAWINGTSMASASVAGAAALLRAVQPEWTPMEVQSALLLTANAAQKRSDGLTPATPDDVGSGMPQLNLAARSGLVLDESVSRLLAANPATGGKPRLLNLASLRNSNCGNRCVFARTLRNTRELPSQWQSSALFSNAPGVSVTVSPSTFSFSGGLSETREIIVVVELAAGTVITTPVFGEVRLTETTAQSPEARLTLAIAGTSNGDGIFATGFESAE